MLTQNVHPLLHEIRHAMAQLLDKNQTRVIDLRGIPLVPGEEEQIEKILGYGEVHAQMDAMGPSEFRETSYPGVWLVTHFNHERQLMGKYVEIAYFPSLLKSQDDDIAEGMERLDEQLNLEKAVGRARRV